MGILYFKFMGVAMILQSMDLTITYQTLLLSCVDLYILHRKDFYAGINNAKGVSEYL